MPEPTTIARYLRAVAGQPSDGPTDAELLARFAAARDQGAFELLVWRHAGMVTAVCHRVLRDRHAAEDATQAAFLALARKASSVRENPAGWLFRVARRIAVKMASRRVVLPTASTSVTPAVNDDVEVLHDELARLPDKYRLPVLLCFFEGLSHADAARRLGWPAGTVAGRIARAKDTLHARLTRRGVAVPAAGLSALCVATDVTGTFAATTTRAALAFATGTGLVGIPEPVLHLAKGAIRDMVISKLQTAAGVAMTFAALATGGVWALGQGPGIGGEPPLGGAAAGSGSPAGGEGAGTLPPTTTLQRLVLPANAPAPGTPAEPKREANYEQRLRSKDNLKHIAAAIINHEATYQHLPNDSFHPETGKPLLSWRVYLLPYLEHDALYRKFKFNEPWDSAHNKKLVVEMPDVYRLGSQAKAATDTHYQTFAGPGTPFESGKNVTFAHVADGLSNTLGVAEVGPAVPWTKPADAPYNPNLPFPKVTWPYSNVISFSMLDGVVHSVKPDLGEATWRLLIERDDGKNIPDLQSLRPSFPAEAAEEKAILARTLDANAALLAELDAAYKTHLALLKVKNSYTTDVDKARAQHDELKRLIAAYTPRIKKERDELGIPRNAKIPEPKELPKP